MLTSILFSLQNADTQNCQHTSVFCNCDADEPRWLADEGFLTQPEELGITQIFALQQRHLIPQGEGRITLGPLECVEASKKNDTHDKESNEKYPTLVILQSPVLHHFDILQIRSSTSSLSNLLIRIWRFLAGTEVISLSVSELPARRQFFCTSPYSTQSILTSEFYWLTVFMRLL